MSDNIFIAAAVGAVTLLIVLGNLLMDLIDRVVRK